MQKTLCRWSEAARKRGDMCQKATPGTCVPCLPGEIEPWAECLWVWRNYRLGGRLTCRWHQRRQPTAEVEKPAVVIVHKLRRHVFEEFMRWLNCTKREEYPRRRRRRRRRRLSCLVSRAHTTLPREKSASIRVSVSLCVVHRVCLSHCERACVFRARWICHRAPIMFAEVVVFTSPVSARSSAWCLTSTLLHPPRWIMMSALDQDIPEPLCPLPQLGLLGFPDLVLATVQPTYSCPVGGRCLRQFSSFFFVESVTDDLGWLGTVFVE